MPDTAPARWAVPIGDQYYGTVLTLSVMSEPSGVDFSGMTIAWTGADVDPDYSVYAYRDRTVAGAANVSVQVTDEDAETSSAAAEVVVVAIDHIASDDANLVEAETGNSTNAVTGVSSDPATVTVIAVVTPTVPDVSSVYNKLIVWGGTSGEVGSPANRYLLPRDAAKRMPVSARIGASSDTLDVWAVQVNLIAGGLAEDEEELDANAVEVRVNSDDDNENGMADVSESNGAAGLGVMGEDELVSVALDLAPRGVPVGELALALPAGGHVAACASENKAGGRLAVSSWDLAAGAPPSGVSLEGISTVGPQSLSLQYRLGGATVSEDTAKITCVEIPDTGGAGACYKLYRTRTVGMGGTLGAASLDGGQQSFSGTAHTESAAEVSGAGTVGGEVLVTLVVTQPYGAYTPYEVSCNQVADTYAPSEIRTDIGFDMRAMWWKYDPHAPCSEWEFVGDGPYTQNTSNPPETYVLASQQLLWDTRTAPTLSGYTPPMGHNGRHTMGIYEVFSYPSTHVPAKNIPILTLEQGMVANGPRPAMVDVRNLVIEQNSITTNATIDYLKYDPDSENPALRAPSMSFTVSDADTAGYTYQYVIFMQPTGAAGTQYLDSLSTRWVRGVFDFGGSQTKTVDVPGEKMLESSAFSEGWGTYTFDVGVIESDSNGNIVDRFYYKWPYCLSVGDHDVWIKYPGDENVELRCQYQLHDYASQHSYDVYTDERNIQLLAVNGNLEEIDNIDGETELNIWHGNDGSGILVHKGEDLFGFSRTIFIGEDYCWEKYRRDHQASRMLAQNEGARVNGDGVLLLFDYHQKGDWENPVGLNYNAIAAAINCLSIDNEPPIWTFISFTNLVDSAIKLPGVPKKIPEGQRLHWEGEVSRLAAKYHFRSLRCITVTLFSQQAHQTYDKLQGATRLSLQAGTPQQPGMCGLNSIENNLAIVNHQDYQNEMEEIQTQLLIHEIGHSLSLVNGKGDGHCPVAKRLQDQCLMLPYSGTEKFLFWNFRHVYLPNNTTVGPWGTPGHRRAHYASMREFLGWLSTNNILDGVANDPTRNGIRPFNQANPNFIPVRGVNEQGQQLPFNTEPGQ